MGFIIGRRRTLRLTYKIRLHRVTPAALCAEWFGAFSVSDDDMSYIGETQILCQIFCSWKKQLSLQAFKCTHSCSILISIVTDNDLANEVRHTLDYCLMQADGYQWVELSVVQ